MNNNHHHHHHHHQQQQQENLPNRGLNHPCGPLSECQRKLKETTKKDVEHEGDNDTNFNWCAWNDPKTTALFRSARILRRVLETWGFSDSRERPSANVGVKKLVGIIIIIIIII